MSTENPQPQTPPNRFWFKGPLLMYLAMVSVFAILAIFVIHHVIALSATTP
jgi:hypothetical protein